MNIKIEKQTLTDKSVAYNVLIVFAADELSGDIGAANLKVRIGCVSCQHAASLERSLERASFIELA